jgi:hypothetical protein
VRTYKKRFSNKTRFFKNPTWLLFYQHGKALFEKNTLFQKSNLVAFLPTWKSAFYFSRSAYSQKLLILQKRFFSMYR